jgi:hypothetical protein
MTYEYSNTEMKYQQDGKKIVRKVYMKNGKGYKSVTKYSKRGKKLSTVKKPIHETHAEHIRMGRFVPGLFADCVSGNRTRKNCHAFAFVPRIIIKQI